MGSRRRGLGIAAVVALAAASAGWTLWARPARPAPHALERPAPAVAEDAAGSPGPTPDRPAAPPPPPVSAGAPAACPEDDEDPPGFVRPSVWELLRTRTQELRDRLPQLSRDASPALREGLNGLGGDDPLDAVNRLRAAPDRDRDGFDVASAAMLHLGMVALGAGDAADARRWAERARREDREDPLAWALEGLAMDRAGHAADAARLLAGAHARAPDEPALALAAARAHAEVGDFEAARRAADAYLAAIPEDARIDSWRARMAARAELTRTFARRTDQGVTVLWPDRAVDVRRVDALGAAARDAIVEVARETDTTPREGLVVVVYESMDDFRRATCAPSWSGGLFDGVLHLDAATVRGPRLVRVARHEATHAQLRTLRAPIPSWLNEGLAQAMEGPPPPASLDAWRRLTERRYWIPFASLEGELVVIDDPDAAALAYHQSLAMFLFLRERGGPGAVRAAFARVEEGQPEDLLGALVEGADGDALLAFLGEELAATR